MKIIKNQVITTTSKDYYGVRTTRDMLLSMIKQINEPLLLNQGHDLSLPPAGKATNFRLIDMADGESQIIADIELWDEQLVVVPGGLSPSFIPIYDGDNLEAELEPELEIFLNPFAIPFDLAKEVFKDSIENSKSKIRLREIHQRGIDISVIVMLYFVTGAIATGFFSKIGEDIWITLKYNLFEFAKRAKAESDTDIIFHSTFDYNIGGNATPIIVVFKKEHIEVLMKNPINIEGVKSYVEAKVGNSRLNKVVVSLKIEEPFYQITNIIDSEGKSIDL